MHDTLSSPNPCAPGGNGEAGQGICMGGVEAIRGNRPVRAGADAGTSHESNEKMSKADLILYALTLPLRLALFFVCAVGLIVGICVMSCAGGDR